MTLKMEKTLTVLTVCSSERQSPLVSGMWWWPWPWETSISFSSLPDTIIKRISIKRDTTKVRASPTESLKFGDSISFLVQQMYLENFTIHLISSHKSPFLSHFSKGQPFANLTNQNSRSFKVQQLHKFSSKIANYKFFKLKCRIKLFNVSLIVSFERYGRNLRNLFNHTSFIELEFLILSRFDQKGIVEKRRQVSRFGLSLHIWRIWRRNSVVEL